MSYTGSFRIINAIENGTLTPAGLQTLLGNARSLAEWQAICGTRHFAERLFSTTAGVNAVLGSALAKAEVLKSLTALQVALSVKSAAASLLADNATATDIYADAEKVKVLACNRMALQTIYESDPACSLLQNSAKGIDLLKLTSAYETVYRASDSASVNFALLPNSARRVLVLTFACNYRYGFNHTFSTIRSGSTISGVLSVPANPVELKFAKPLSGTFGLVGEQSYLSERTVGFIRCD